MQLFEKELIDKLERKYAGKRWARPNIAFLATDPRVERERQRIQDWFNEIPMESKRSIKGRFTSEDDRQHFSAYNELVVHRFLQNNGLEHEFEPEVAEGEPDFLVKAATDFYLELASVFESRDLTKDISKLQSLLEELSKIEHYFFLGIEDYVIPDNISYRHIKRFIQEWMDSFDPSTLSEMRETTYDQCGLKLDLVLIPKSSAKKGPIVGMSMFPAIWVSAENVRRTLQQKIKKYKSIAEMKLPYVVALSLEDKYVDLDNIIDVLFGRETVYLNRNSLEGEVIIVVCLHPNHNLVEKSEIHD